jgi:hypothetical protein
MKRDVSPFGGSTKCRTCCFPKDAAEHMNHASTVNIDMHTQWMQFNHAYRMKLTRVKFGM